MANECDTSQARYPQLKHAELESPTSRIMKAPASPPQETAVLTVLTLPSPPASKKATVKDYKGYYNGHYQLK